MNFYFLNSYKLLRFILLKTKFLIRKELKCFESTLSSFLKLPGIKNDEICPQIIIRYITWVRVISKMSIFLDYGTVLTD